MRPHHRRNRVESSRVVPRTFAFGMVTFNSPMLKCKVSGPAATSQDLTPNQYKEPPLATWIQHSSHTSSNQSKMETNASVATKNTPTVLLKSGVLDASGALTRQWQHGIAAQNDHWLIGHDVVGTALAFNDDRPSALRSMINPGTANPTTNNQTICPPTTAVLRTIEAFTKTLASPTVPSPLPP